MTSISLDQAQRDLPKVVADVLAKAEPCVVVTATGKQVVVMCWDDFHAWNETAYLLSSDANATHLRRGMAVGQAVPDFSDSSVVHRKQKKSGTA
jgi:antitoxin YefM